MTRRRSYGSEEQSVLNIFPGPIVIDDLAEYRPILANDDTDDSDPLLTSRAPSSSSSKEIPYFLDPYVIPNAGLFLSYFNVGVASYLLQSPLSYYLIDTLNISSTSYSAYYTLIALPWSLKFIFGCITDGTPILGYRRKSWMLIGWVVYILAAFALALTGQPTFAQVTTFGFTMTCAFILADVVNDALCVERARYEFEAIKGSLQTAGYTIRAYGCIIGSFLGAILYNTPQWGWGLSVSQILVLSGMIPLTNVLPMVWNLQEIASRKATPSYTEIFASLWDTLQLRAVWYPMIFIYTYYIFQIPNASWTNFLVKGLAFTDFELGLLTITGAVLYWLGMVVFKLFLFDTSWRNIFIYTTTVNFFFSLGQVILILRLNRYIGIPDIVFALGDSGIIYFLFAINSMPTSIMFVMLCPEGAEGVIYALLTTISNLAWAVSYDIGTWLSTLFDVSNATLLNGDFAGVLKITVLTSFMQVMPIFLVGILPNSRKEQRILRDSGVKSFWGGVWMLTVVVFSLGVTMFYNSYLILYST